jgi:protein SCO1/2
MSRRTPTAAALLLAMLAAFAAPAAAAERPAAAVEAARAYFTDVELVDQNGETRRLYSDLMDGKVVVVSSMFTTCVAVCPLLGQKMQRLQEAAGERLGRDVHLLSITVDPEVDTPAKLRAYGEQFEAREGWYFLTGSRENVGQALAKLGFAVDDKESHSTVVLMGNEKTGLWKKTNGLAPAGDLVELLQGVLADDGSGPAYADPAKREG